jgi:phage tail-like protein
MLRVMARSKVTWGAIITALVAGSALLLMLTSQSLYPHSAQAAQQPAPQPPPPKTQLVIDGVVIAEFRTLNEVASTIEPADPTTEPLPGTSKPLGTAKPASIVLERKADDKLELSAWHQAARQGQLDAARKNVSLIYFDSSGQATMRLFLENAWPSEYRLTQKGSELVEEVTLTAETFQRVSP